MLYDLPDRPLPPEPQANKPRSPGTYRDGRQWGYRDLPPSDEDYEPAIPGTRPYYGVPGAIPPGPADSAKQDAIRREAMRSRMPISPGQIGQGPGDAQAFAKQASNCFLPQLSIEPAASTGIGLWDDRRSLAALIEILLENYCLEHGYLKPERGKRAAVSDPARDGFCGSWWVAARWCGERPYKQEPRSGCGRGLELRR